MLALVLMVGVVIDDAIVVLENIFRFIEEKKMLPMQAAVYATKDIGLAVMATTLSLIVVFLSGLVHVVDLGPVSVFVRYYGSRGYPRIADRELQPHADDELAYAPPRPDAGHTVITQRILRSYRKLVHAHARLVHAATARSWSAWRLS